MSPQKKDNVIKVAEEATRSELVLQSNGEPEAEIEVSDFQCILCDFKSNWKNGLSIHMARKHSQIEQLDGNADISILENNDDEKYESTKHYWEKGYLGGGFQTYIDAIEVIEEMNLSDDEMKDEKAKLLEARKGALGENFKYCPPWS